MNTYIIIGIIVIAVGGLIGSCLIYYGQKIESNKDTDKQTKHREEIKEEIVNKLESDDKFLKENRPILSISHLKLKDGSNIKIENLQDSIRVSFHFKVENIGNANANNIKHTGLFHGSINDVSTKEFIDSGSMSLGPSEAVGINMGLTFIPDDKKSINESFENFKTGQFEVGVGLSYENEFDSSLYYIRKFSINGNQKKVTIIKYDHETMKK